MAWWVNAAQELLQAVGAGTSRRQVEFVTDWNANASANCANNPLDVSRPSPLSTGCQRLTPTRVARNYLGPNAAVVAFRGQVESGNFPHVLAALRSPNPYTYPHKAEVYAELREWGSLAFAEYYHKHVTIGPPPPPPPGPPPGGLPKGHGGYRALQKALARSVPTNLHKAKVIRHRVLRKLGAPRRLG